MAHFEVLTQEGMNFVKATRTLMGAYMSGEDYCRSFEGPGQVILCSVPYWRYRMFTQQPAQPQQIAVVE